MNPEVETSQALVARLIDLQSRVRSARMTEAEINQKIGATMTGGCGQIAGDDLIAASFPRTERLAVKGIAEMREHPASKPLADIHHGASERRAERG